MNVYENHTLTVQFHNLLYGIIEGIYILQFWEKLNYYRIMKNSCCRGQSYFA